MYWKHFGMIDFFLVYAFCASVDTNKSLLPKSRQQRPVGSGRRQSGFVLTFSERMLCKEVAMLFLLVSPLKNLMVNICMQSTSFLLSFHR